MGAHTKFFGCAESAPPIVERIRAAEETAPGIPMDASLYAGEVTYRHGDGPERAFPRDAFLSRIGKEQAAFGAFVSGDSAKLTNFAAGPGRIVAKTERKGRLPNGASDRYLEPRSPSPWPT